MTVLPGGTGAAKYSTCHTFRISRVQGAATGRQSARSFGGRQLRRSCSPSGVRFGRVKRCGVTNSIPRHASLGVHRIAIVAAAVARRTLGHDGYFWGRLWLDRHSTCRSGGVLPVVRNEFLDSSPASATSGESSEKVEKLTEAGTPCLSAITFDTTAERRTPG